MLLAFIWSLSALELSQPPQDLLYLVLRRRGGPLASRAATNLTSLATLVMQTEARYGRTSRVVDGNKLGRRWKSWTSGTAVDQDLVSEPGHPGRW